MSVSALATAVAVAAASVPDESAPASFTAFSSESAALVLDPAEIGPAAGSVEQSPPTTADQYTGPLQLPESLETTEPADAAQATDAATPAQPEAPVPPPPGGSSDIIVTGRRPSPADPLEELNATTFEITRSVDESVVAPVAFAYGEVMPRPVRKGLQNFLHNLGEPIVFINYMLQLKPGKAAETLGRFAINTTLGVGGVVDVAKRPPFNLPRRRNGFANTMGYYGVKPGPYFYLPLVGPTTLRDFIGDRLDLLIMPRLIGGPLKKPEIIVPIWVLKELGNRIDFDDELQQIRATQDPYVAARTHYLERRQAEIDALRGRAPAPVAPAPASSDPAPVQNPPSGPIPAGQ